MSALGPRQDCSWDVCELVVYLPNLFSNRLLLYMYCTTCNIFSGITPLLERKTQLL